MENRKLDMVNYLKAKVNHERIMQFKNRLWCLSDLGVGVRVRPLGDVEEKDKSNVNESPDYTSVDIVQRSSKALPYLPFVDEPDSARRGRLHFWVNSAPSLVELSRRKRQDRAVGIDAASEPHKRRLLIRNPIKHLIRG